MNAPPGNRTLAVMAIWLCLLSFFSYWLEMDTMREEKQLALKTANAFFQQILISRLWNASHGGVYVPVTKETQPNEYLRDPRRDLTADNGMRLTKINPSYMTRQMAELALRNKDGIQFHITSLKPIKPENKAADWEAQWLRSFEQGAVEQGEFVADGDTTWFRYMAPLLVTTECLTCHSQQGYREGEIRGGLSVSLPYPTHSHLSLLSGYGVIAVIGLIFIFISGTRYERKRLLFDATFNSTLPTCVTANDYTILMANESYWSEFGPLPAGTKTIKCFEHRPGRSCHTDKCPLTQITGGSDKYVCEPSKEREGAAQHFIVTARPLLDAKGRVAGIVESFQDITARKKLEEEKERLIEALKKSLDKVKQLRGLIPICASCKKIRDDQGFWTQVESYITSHSEAQFSHGICPACVKKLYPELSEQILAAASQTRPPSGE